MSGLDETTGKQKKTSYTRPVDFFVVIFCIFGIIASLYLFQRDIFMSLRSSAVEAGTVTIRYNTVQRRLKDRVIWDRLFKESPVYDGDLIRIASLSAATINVQDNHIELDENTLIRVQKMGNVTLIDTFTGSMNVVSGGTGGVLKLSIGDQVVEAAPGTVFSASSSDEEGIMLRVTEGTAQVVRDGRVDELRQGSVIAQDARGNELRVPTAAVSYPRPNARLLKTGARPLDVRFVWTGVNLPPSSPVVLEVARDRNFSNITHSIENYDSDSVAALDAGIWHWRLSCEGTVLSTGRLTVTDAAPPTLFDPPQGNVVAYRTTPPEVQLRWTEVPQASHYILQVDDAPNFSNPDINVPVQGTSYIAPDLEADSWYWRVLPVYPNVYEGDAGFSESASFRVEQVAEAEPPTLLLPAPNGTVNIDSDHADIFFTWTNIREAASYNFTVSRDSGLNDVVIEKTVRNNYFVYGRGENILVPGQYFWSVSFTDAQGYASPRARERAFVAVETNYVQRLVSPADRYTVEREELSSLVFEWETNMQYDRRFQLSSAADFSRPEIDESVNVFEYKGVSLPPGEWYWRITARKDTLSPSVPSPARRLTVASPEPLPAAATPAEEIPPEELPAAEEQPEPETLQDWLVQLHGMTPQEVLAAQMPPEPPPAVQAAQRAQASQPQAAAQQTTLQPQTAPQQAASRTQQTQQAQPARQEPPPPLRLTLMSPGRGSVIAGLTAVRQPTVFRWETREEVASSRFVLSRQANPLTGIPEVEIRNPGRSISVERLAEGQWYWTIEARSRDGRVITPESPGQFRVQPIPLLGAPSGMQPARGYRLDANILRSHREVVFSWSAVEGANAYILTINRESPPQRRILQTDPMRELNYTFNNLTLFDNSGTYTWQVEAVSRSADGRIDQRGRPGVNSFELDVPRPGRVRTRDMGPLYGTE